jgi:hypothetical protein
MAARESTQKYSPALQISSDEMAGMQKATR